MPVKKENKNEMPESIAIKLVWEDTNDIPTTYANNIYITHAGNEFFLVFGELSPLMELDPEKIPAEFMVKPVAKIAITPDNMLKFAEVISVNVAKFKEKIEKSKDVLK